MKTRAIIEFKDTYASMECQELGYQTKETALAIISPTGQILSSTPLFRKAYGSNTAHIDQLPFTIDTLNITAKGLSEKVRANLEDWIAILLFFQWTMISTLLNIKHCYIS